MILTAITILRAIGIKTLIYHIVMVAREGFEPPTKRL
jgi:hypothetical protein